MAKPKPKEDMLKVTHYVTVGQAAAIEMIRAKRIQAGVKLGDVDKSSIMREALDLLIEKEGV